MPSIIETQVRIEQDVYPDRERRSQEGETDKVKLDFKVRSKRYVAMKDMERGNERNLI